MCNISVGIFDSIFNFFRIRRQLVYITKDGMTMDIIDIRASENHALEKIAIEGSKFVEGQVGLVLLNVLKPDDVRRISTNLALRLRLGRQRKDIDTLTRQPLKKPDRNNRRSKIRRSTIVKEGRMSLKPGFLLGLQSDPLRPVYLPFSCCCLSQNIISLNVTRFGKESESKTVEKIAHLLLAINENPSVQYVDDNIFTSRIGKRLAAAIETQAGASTSPVHHMKRKGGTFDAQCPGQLVILDRLSDPLTPLLLHCDVGSMLIDIHPLCDPGAGVGVAQDGLEDTMKNVITGECIINETNKATTRKQRDLWEVLRHQTMRDALEQIGGKMTGGSRGAQLHTLLKDFTAKDRRRIKQVLFAASALTNLHNHSRQNYLPLRDRFYWKHWSTWEEEILV